MTEPTPTTGEALDVGQLHHYLNTVLDHVGDVRVTGTVTAWRPHRSGWIRAELATHDANGVPTAKISVAIAPRYRPADTITTGARVEVRGVARTHPIYTPLELQAHRTILLAERSQNHETLRARFAELDANGQLDANKRLVVPDQLDTVGLVHPASGGAGWHDTTSILTSAGVTILSHPAPMMGQGSADRIAAAITRAAHRTQIVLVCRGGGAATDLEAFNTVDVVNAIVGSAVPVITGIGHAHDTTAADLVAHHAAATPTAAAEWIDTHANQAADHARNAALTQATAHAEAVTQRARQLANTATQQTAQAERRHRQVILLVALAMVLAAIAFAAVALT